MSLLRKFLIYLISCPPFEYITFLCRPVVKIYGDGIARSLKKKILLKSVSWIRIRLDPHSIGYPGSGSWSMEIEKKLVLIYYGT